MLGVCVKVCVVVRVGLLGETAQEDAAFTDRRLPNKVITYADRREGPPRAPTCHALHECSPYLASISSSCAGESQWCT